MLKKVDWKDVGIRALKTFVQAACATTVTLISAGNENVFGDTALISVLAAGISAVWNGVLNPLLDSWIHGNE